MHVVGRTGTGIVGLGHGILHEPHGRGLQIVQALLEALGVKREGFVSAVFLAEIADFLEQRHDGTATIEAELATDEVKGLDAVRTFVDHRDAGIADILAHAPFFDIAMAAIDLLRHHRMVKALVGQHAFEDRRHQA